VEGQTQLRDGLTDAKVDRKVLPICEHTKKDQREKKITLRFPCVVSLPAPFLSSRRFFLREEKVKEKKRKERKTRGKQAFPSAGHRKLLPTTQPTSHDPNQ
jgi:hypothetical protein